MLAKRARSSRQLRALLRGLQLLKGGQFFVDIAVNKTSADISRLIIGWPVNDVIAPGVVASSTTETAADALRGYIDKLTVDHEEVRTYEHSDKPIVDRMVTALPSREGDIHVFDKAVLLERRVNLPDSKHDGELIHAEATLVLAR